MTSKNKQQPMPIDKESMSQAEMTDGMYDAVEAMKDQLIIALVDKLGGKVNLPEHVINDTGGKLLTMEVDQDKREFTFKVIKKD